jgi:hypothetical protein
MRTHITIALLLASALPAAAQNQPQNPLDGGQALNSILQQAAQAIAGQKLPPGYRFIGGDMIMPDSFNPYVDGFYRTNLWTNGTVPYAFVASTFSAAEQTNIIAAMQVWQNLANVHFVPHTNEANFVVIDWNGGNSSMVGMQGGSQLLYYAHNQVQSVYEHELGHCLGFVHEHQRYDRASFILINPCRVQGVTCDQFGSVTGTTSTYDNNFPPVNNGTAWAAYDFRSIMHYDRCAFSSGCPAGSSCNCTVAQETMQVQPPYATTFQSVIGNAAAPSYLDGITMRGLYAFAGDRWIDTTYGGAQAATFQQPYNGNVLTYYLFVPSGGTLFFKAPGHYSGVGVYNQPVTMDAPGGPVVIGS